ncbi:hypothetical protein FLP41_09355 [Paracoccus marcusii]|uniref:hypothetical protein n=1 Tax=Paracoccus marcusii TaxID=59779 RepID=UPI002ED39F00|nr:hypothetical protein FLP41_09355 [Paracoccus marcusii]
MPRESLARGTALGDLVGVSASAASARPSMPRTSGMRDARMKGRIVSLASAMTAVRNVA